MTSTQSDMAPSARKYIVTVTQIRPHNGDGCKYRVDVKAAGGDYGWSDYTFVMFKMNARWAARQLVRKNERKKFQTHVIKEFEL